KARLDSDAFAVSSLAGSVTVQGVTATTSGATVTATGVAGTGDATDGYTQYVLTFGGAATQSFSNNVVTPALGNTFTTLLNGFYSLDMTGSKVHAGTSNAATSSSTKFWVLYGAVNALDVKINGALGDASTDTLLVDGVALNDV